MSLWNKKNKTILLVESPDHGTDAGYLLGTRSCSSKLELPPRDGTLSVTIVVAFSNVVISLLRKVSLAVFALSSSSSSLLHW